MANFRYRARDPQGQLQNGVVEAASEQAAAEVLSRRALIILQTAAYCRPKLSTGGNNRCGKPSVGLTELIVFARQMYALMKAGIPIIRAIRGLAESTAFEILASWCCRIWPISWKKAVIYRRRCSVIRKCLTALSSVLSMSAKTPAGWMMPFSQLSDYFEQELETRKQIKQATRYPIFVLIAIVVAMVILNLLVIPQFANMFARFNAELPWSTQVLLATSTLFYPLLVLFLLLTLVGRVIVGLSLCTDPRWQLSLEQT